MIKDTKLLTSTYHFKLWLYVSYGSTIKSMNLKYRVVLLQIMNFLKVLSFPLEFVI